MTLRAVMAVQKEDQDENRRNRRRRALTEAASLDAVRLHHHRNKVKTLNCPSHEILDSDVNKTKFLRPRPRLRPPEVNKGTTQI